MQILNFFLTMKKYLLIFVVKKDKIFFGLYAPTKQTLPTKLHLFVLFDIQNLKRISLLDEKVLTPEKLFTWFIYLNTCPTWSLEKNL